MQIDQNHEVSFATITVLCDMETVRERMRADASLD
jgi:hypothetical protein